MKSFYWLLKREIWEHRSFLIVPVVISALAIVFLLIGMMFFFANADSVAHAIEHSKSGNYIGALAPEQRYLVTTVTIMSSAAPFNLVMLILIVVYLLDALYGERRDRSILFWKSLPVSDTATVLSKLATATLVAPLITLAVVAIAQFVALVIGSIGALLLGIGGWGWVWNPLGWLLGWASLGYGYLLLGVVLLPYLAWLLLASAWARRAPFLWAVVPPVTLMIFEKWFLDSGYLRQWIFGHLGNVPRVMFRSSSGDTWENIAGGHSAGMISLSLELFAQPAVWGGIFIAALFIAAAVWLRRYRDET